MKNLVNVSEGAYLALHGLALLHQRAPQRVSVKAMAAELHASEAHLAKIFQKLHKAGIVDSVRGPAGGFFLSSGSEDSTFLDIYEIVEGKVKLGGCPFGKINCAFASCIFSGELNRLSKEIYDFFKSMKIKDFS